MEANQILDHLFFINNELKLEDVDPYFEKLGFQNTTREDTLLAYISTNSNDLNGISWFVMNITGGKIMNSSFRTTKEINLESILNYAETEYGFSFEVEVDDIIIYKRDKLQLHIRTSTFPTSQFSKVMHEINLFEPFEKRVEVVMISPPPPF